MTCGVATEGAAAAPGATGEAAPPGLKRTTSSVQAHPAPDAAAARGQPARPTFQSSQPAPAAAPTGAAGPKFGLTVLAGPARGQRFRLGVNGAQMGRSKGVILFPEDPFVSPLHASLQIRDGQLFIRDEGSTSGVFISVAGQEHIDIGTAFCVGLRLFRYVGAISPAAPWNKRDVLVYGAPLPNGVVHYALEEVLLGDRPGVCITSPGPSMSIGQGKCDFSFPSDEGIAQRHAEITPSANGASLKDLSGGLGTYVRIRAERPLKAGDRLRVGQQTLQVEVQM